MKKRMKPLIAALLLLPLLSACRQPEIENLLVFDPSMATTAPTAAPVIQQVPVDPPVTDWDAELNPAQEEDINPEGQYVPGLGPQPGYVFAGATPMPLNPIDMPTPTPRPKLTFTYREYDVTRMGISFSAPDNWEVDDSVDGIILLQQPEADVLDNYRAFLSIEIRATNATLSKAEMRTQLKGILETLRGGYVTWEQKVEAERTLMQKTGFYNDYRGVMMDGTIVRGRVQVASVNKKTVTVHISCPGGFNEDFMGGVYTKLRNTLKETR
ncbi:MAG: hypothetical protein FWF47_06100 [Clostridia bacterium]|nr:hypothetical protein [Clostridia bacterium]